MAPQGQEGAMVQAPAPAQTEGIQRAPEGAGQPQLQAPDQSRLQSPEGQEAPRGQEGGAPQTQEGAGQEIKVADPQALEVNNQDEGLIKAGHAGDHVNIDEDANQNEADYQDGRHDDQDGGQDGEEAGDGNHYDNGKDQQYQEDENDAQEDQVQHVDLYPSEVDPQGQGDHMIDDPDYPDNSTENDAYENDANALDKNQYNDAIGRENNAGVEEKNAYEMDNNSYNSDGERNVDEYADENQHMVCCIATFLIFTLSHKIAVFSFSVLLEKNSDLRTAWSYSFHYNSFWLP